MNNSLALRYRYNPKSSWNYNFLFRLLDGRCGDRNHGSRRDSNPKASQIFSGLKYRNVGFKGSILYLGENLSEGLGGFKPGVGRLVGESNYSKYKNREDEDGEANIDDEFE
ncbi:hypothetical protein NE237_022829 [Protea cynaroides]|uniref:Uncharacterized protein n=1 Tax=Protea cynaroides TaxID=273540 RepID=A0A9Q0HDX2_9MAGN|nr:hypothetical protein NE237_022829 [Protea cynaroides]